MSTPTPSIPGAQEEIRLEVKGRFEAVNKAAAYRRQRQQNAGEPSGVEEKKQMITPEAGAAGVHEIGENDSLGG